MYTLDFVIVVSILVISISITIFFVFRTLPKKNTQINQTEETGRLLKEKTKLEGQLSEVNKQVVQLTSKLEAKETILEDKEKDNFSLKAELKEERKQVKEEIKELRHSKEKFQEEQNRVRKQEEEDIKRNKENQDRIWNDHEGTSLAIMKSICKKEEIALPCYTNKEIPSDFPKQLKPDFMVKIMDQYIIFDAKLSKGSTINEYLKKQVKDTGKKYKGVDMIFPFIFFIIPHTSIHEIKETYHLCEKFHFYVLTVEAFEPIVRTLKKLEDYSFAENFDPENREKIVHCLAIAGRQIKQNIAVNILGITSGTETLEQFKGLPEDVSQEVENTEKNITFEDFSIHKMKEIRDSSLEKQKQKLIELITPNKPDLPIEDIEKLVEENESSTE